MTPLWPHSTKATPPTLAGFLFCLASAEGAGLLFLPCCNAASYKHLQCVLCHPCRVMPSAPQNSIQGFAGAFPVICPTQPPTITDATPGRCTAQRRPPIIIRYIRVQGYAPVMDPCQTMQHTADHASQAGPVSTVCGSLASAAPGAPAEWSASPPVQGHPGGLRSGAGQQSGHTGSAWHPPPGGAVQQQGARRAARNH